MLPDRTDACLAAQTGVIQAICHALLPPIREDFEKIPRKFVHLINDSLTPRTQGLRSKFDNDWMEYSYLWGRNLRVGPAITLN
jgi:hypothetical protein